MKVYALREQQLDYSFMPVIGYHSSLLAAKKQAKPLFNRSAAWDIVSYEIKTRFTKEDIIDLLNGDSLSANIEGKVPRDYLDFVKIEFENATMKRYRKELRDAVEALVR